MIAIVDYGAGNIFSVKNALDFLGCKNILTNNKMEIESADAVILPGVGAFPAAMKMLDSYGIVDVLRSQSKIKPFLGICLGMQMIFEKGYEFEETNGIGIIKGSIEKIIRSDLSVPHMGWNKLVKKNYCKLLEGLSDNEYMYFVHSYAAKCADSNVSAYCEYGGKITALVHDGNYVYGAQFHPEKSGSAGLKILRNFADLI